MTVRYAKLADELRRMFEADQTEKKALAKRVFQGEGADYSMEQKELADKTARRSARLLEILDEIVEPSLTNIGDEGALTVSVLATHDMSILKRVLDAFNKLYESDKANCRYQSIPAMTDAYLMSQRKPQRFGTQWFFDDQNYPFLYLVEDFENVNQRRAEYGIEPLRWPKSLAIPESQQPWLSRPLSELIMRMPTGEEFIRNLG